MNANCSSSADIVAPPRCSSPAVDEQLSCGRLVGTTATIGATTPATLSRASSSGVAPSIATKATPIAIRAPTNTVWTGV